MFGWGMIGWTAGILYQWGWLKNRFMLLAFGFVWGFFFFGWIMNIWVLANMGRDLTWLRCSLLMPPVFYFDLAHALSNVFFFLAVLGPGWIKICSATKGSTGCWKKIMSAAGSIYGSTLLPGFLRGMAGSIISYIGP